MDWDVLWASPTPPTPARAPVKASLVRLRGGSCLVIRKESTGVPGGEGSPTPPTARWARVSQPRGHDDSGQFTLDRVPQKPRPARGLPDEVCWLFLWTGNLLCFQKALQPTSCHLPLGFPKAIHGKSDLPATEEAGSQHQKYACRRQGTGASGRSGRCGPGPRLMQFSVSGGGRAARARRVGSVAHPHQVPRLRPGPRGRSRRC